METIPKIIFIVPYRNRPYQQHFFNTYMKHVLEDYSLGSVKIFFVEQSKQHTNFNRGAVKNIGFMAMRERYPNHYKDITFVFNDVDTVPYKKNILPYETKHGMIRHFYGKQFALGGIFSITGNDFERIGGFPNYWTWGHEDVVIVKRAERKNIIINRAIFFDLHNPAIIQLNNETTRIVDISTSFVDTDDINTLNIIMNIDYKVYDNNTFHSNFVYIKTFDLAIAKHIFDHTIDLTKGEGYHKQQFGKSKALYKKKHGEKKQYFINSIPGAKEHLLRLGLLS